MPGSFVSRGFWGRRQQPTTENRIPPGQYVTPDFPVLSAGPTPHTPIEQWGFRIEGLVRQPVSWSWDEFISLPAKTYIKDIHCVTKWSKLDTQWKGVSVDTLFTHIDLDPKAIYAEAFSDGGYTTNLPVKEILNDQAFIAFEFDGKTLEAEHGGPARLVVPHLYFWKSAKWVRGFRLMEKDEPGFWESLGYSNHGDPWKEERYWGD